MAVLLIVGGCMIALGAALDQPWLVIVGCIPVCTVPCGLLVPAYRISASSPASASKDWNFIGGWMKVLGFSSNEINDSMTPKPRDEDHDQTA